MQAPQAPILAVFQRRYVDWIDHESVVANQIPTWVTSYGLIIRDLTRVHPSR